MVTPIIVDNSCLAAIASCHTQAVVRYHLGMVSTQVPIDEDAPRRAGIAIHAGIAHYWGGGNADEAIAIIRALYKPWADANVPQDEPRMLWPNIERVARSWFTRIASDLPYEPIPSLVEISFAVKLPQGVQLGEGGLVHPVYLTGRLDGIGIDTAGAGTFVTETKTTGQRAKWWMKQYQIASQVSHYTYAAQHDPKVQKTLRAMGSDGKIAGVYLNKIDVPVVPSSPRKCTTHSTQYSECGMQHVEHMTQRFERSQELLGAWLTTLHFQAGCWRDLKEEVQTLDDVATKCVAQQGMFNGECRWCEFRQWCLTGRKNHALLRSEPWPMVQQDMVKGQSL